MTGCGVITVSVVISVFDCFVISVCVLVFVLVICWSVWGKIVFVVCVISNGTSYAANSVFVELIIS